MMKRVAHGLHKGHAQNIGREGLACRVPELHALNRTR